MSKRRAAFLTLGCKVNQYETDAMEEILEKAGYEIVSFKETADVYIINTCSVTNMADRKSRQMIHRAKKNNPDAIIVAAGCYVQAAEEELAKKNEADILVGNNKKKDIAQILEEYFAAKEPEQEVPVVSEVIDINHTKEYEDLIIHKVNEHTRAYIKIQDGCNQFCTYCIIPFARGRVRSRKIEDIIDEVRKLAECGCHEIVVTGIHLSSYGLDFDNTEYNAQPVPNAERLLQVLEAIAAVDGIDRIRLGSLEPRIITDTFLERLSAIPQICPHFHLSLQSGCDETLKRMNRRYDTEEFREGVEKIRRYFDKPAITTDVIVGFPGETDEEFAITMKYLEEINFFEMHVFKYSRRKGTIADRMENQIADSVKSERSDALIELDEELSRAYRESFAGSAEVVLVEEYVECDGIKYAVGHTKRYVKVYISLDCAQAQDIKINAEIPVIITGIFGKDSVISKVAIAN